MSDEKPKIRPRTISSGTRIAAALIAVVGLVGTVPIRHLSRGWDENVWFWINAIIFILCGILCALAFVRPYFSRKVSVRTVRALPRRDGLAWAVLADRWRNNLSIAVLGTIVATATALSLSCLWLQAHSGVFAGLTQKIPPEIGLLLVVTFSTIATFSGAALLGPKLIKYVTGRMPMGKSHSHG